MTFQSYLFYKTKLTRLNHIKNRTKPHNFVVHIRGTGNNLLMTTAVSIVARVFKNKGIKTRRLIWKYLKDLVRDKNEPIILSRKAYKTLRARLLNTRTLIVKSAGMAGYKGAKRRLPYAAQVTGSQVGVKLRKAMIKYRTTKATIIFLKFSKRYNTKLNQQGKKRILVKTVPNNISIQVSGLGGIAKFHSIRGLKTGLGNKIRISTIKVLSQDVHNGCKRRKVRRK